MAQSTLSTATLLLAALAAHPATGQAPTHPVKIGDIVHNMLFPQSELIGTNIRHTPASLHINNFMFYCLIEIF